MVQAGTSLTECSRPRASTISSVTSSVLHRVKNQRSVFQNVRVAIRAPVIAFFEITAVELVFAFVSLSYLLLIVGDLIADEMLPEDASCDHFCEVGNATQPVVLDTTSLAAAKADVAVRVDVGFLCFFFLEMLLRMATQGVVAYLKDVVNAIDSSVLVLSLLIDFVIIVESGLPNFGFVRLVRLVRLIRIVSTYQRLQKRKKLYKLKKQGLLYRTAPAPTLEWKLGPLMQYSAFISHNKHETAPTARFLHTHLQLMLRADAFLGESPHAREASHSHCVSEHPPTPQCCVRQPRVCPRGHGRVPPAPLSRVTMYSHRLDGPDGFSRALLASRR